MGALLPINGQQVVLASSLRYCCGYNYCPPAPLAMTAPAPTTPTIPTTAPEIGNAGPLSSGELAAWRGTLQVNAQVTAALDAQMRAEHGLSVSSYEVLMFLADAPERRLRMSEIADRVLLSRSGLTRLVDRLVQLGYVTRCAAEADGRGSYAELTDVGLDKFRAAQRTHRAGVRAFFLARLSITDTVILGDIWTRFLSSDAA
jgi:DNA-binding MarR family transcriptional regulator